MLYNSVGDFQTASVFIFCSCILSLVNWPLMKMYCYYLNQDNNNLAIQYYKEALKMNTDLNDKAINLQGLDWTMSLEFDFIETPEITTPMDKRLLVEQAQYKRFQDLQKKIKP